MILHCEKEFGRFLDFGFDERTVGFEVRNNFHQNWTETVVRIDCFSSINFGLDVRTVGFEVALEVWCVYKDKIPPAEVLCSTKSSYKAPFFSYYLVQLGCTALGAQNLPVVTC